MYTVVPNSFDKPTEYQVSVFLPNLTEQVKHTSLGDEAIVCRESVQAKGKEIFLSHQEGRG
jgi:hypothetical protein